jgi:pyroglutamyl-peptidase
MAQQQTTLLITGFGPFPGAPYNPTEALVRRLGRLRRPALADVNIVSHVFATSYAAVDRDLPALIARHKPDALLMFGLAGRTRHLRIETRARNALALLPDAAGDGLRRSKIAPGAPAALILPLPAAHLLAATRAAQVPAALSRDAGRYLCNYLIWRAAEASGNGGPPLAAFVHVPLTRRTPRPRRPGKARLTAADLARAGTRLVLAMAAAARR